MSGSKKRTKTIKGYLIVDWKNEKLRARQTKPNLSELGNNELLSNLKFQVNIPNVDVPTLAAEIDVPEPMVYSATLEALEDRELPEYAQTADAIIADRADEIQTIDHHDLENLISVITVQTLRETRGRPRVDMVQDYVAEVIDEIRSTEEDQG